MFAYLIKAVGIWLTTRAINSVLKDQGDLKIIRNVHFYKSKSKEKSAILFVHGFRGEVISTWGKTSEYLSHEEELKNWDLIFLGYNSGLLPNFVDGWLVAVPEIAKIALNISTIINTLKKQKYHSVTICAHSMGGLAVQRAIVDMTDNELAFIRSFVMFGTPSGGLKKARIFKWLNKQTNDLNDKSDFVEDLRKRWVNQNIEDKLNYLSLAGDKDQFVPPRSSLNPFNKRVLGVIGGNHSTMIKPKSRDSQVLQIIKAMVLGNDVFTQDWDPIDVDIQLAEWDKVLAQIGHMNAFKFKNLTERKQVGYLVALDGLGKRKQAMQLLNHIDDRNTDVLGKMGGIFKRSYIQNTTSSISIYKKSYSLYKKGYDLSVTKKENAQIYYHAINLAFLECVEGNFDSCKEWAHKSMLATTTSAEGYWKYATIGEINIYLGNSEDAREAYKKALSFKPDIWEKESMMINISNALEVLNRREEIDYYQNLFKL